MIHQRNILQYNLIYTPDEAMGKVLFLFSIQLRFCLMCTKRFSRGEGKILIYEIYEIVKECNFRLPLSRFLAPPHSPTMLFDETDMLRRVGSGILNSFHFHFRNENDLVFDILG